MHYKKHVSPQAETFFRVFTKDIKGLPKPILRVILAMGIYSFGWGPADAFFSVFLSTFTDDFSTIGFFKTLAALGGAIVLLPLGDLLDRVRHDIIMRFAFLMYVLIGIAYYISGEWLLTPLLMVTLLVHGTMAAILWASAEATLREQSDDDNSSLVFGLHATVHHTLFAIGMFAMLFFADIVPIQYTFLFVIIFSLVALSLMSKSLPARKSQPVGKAIHEVIVKDKLFVAVIKKIIHFPVEMWFMYLLHFCKIGLVAFINGFVILYLEERGASLAVMGGFVAASTLPFLVSFIAAELADRTERLMNIAIGFTIAGLAIGSLTIWNTEIWHVYLVGMVGVFGAAVAGPSISGIVSVLTPKESSGEGTAMIDFVKMVSLAICASAIGLTIDGVGWYGTFAIISLICFALVILVMIMRVRYRHENKIYHINHPDSKKEPYIL